MADRKVFAAARLAHAAQADPGRTGRPPEISTSYVNQLEANQRPLTATVMFALASAFDIELSDLMTAASDRLVSDLREALAGEPVPGALDALGRVRPAVSTSLLDPLGKDQAAH
jgi:transcriptional regulator with XRE-family HTH domain